MKPGPTFRCVLSPVEYDRRYRQGSCVLYRMSLWTERCHLLPNYFGRCCLLMLYSRPTITNNCYTWQSRYYILHTALRVLMHTSTVYPRTPIPLLMCDPPRMGKRKNLIPNAKRFSPSSILGNLPVIRGQTFETEADDNFPSP